MANDANLVVQCGNKPATVRSCDVTPCLFDLVTDPCEYNDLSTTRPKILRSLTSKMNGYRSQVAASRTQPKQNEADPDSHVGIFNGVWVPWQESPTTTTTTA